MNRDIIKELADCLADSSAVVIGAGAGLSASAGMSYAGRRFEENFPDFIARYHFSDMYSGGFYPFPSLEEHWAYWSRYIWINRYQDAPKPVYRDLLQLVKDKDYFVLTTNVDHCFQRAGFDKSRLFYTQGDYGLWQCARPCHNRTYDNAETVRRMVEEQKNLRIPSELVPRCPVCGGPMAMNLRCDSTFVQDAGEQMRVRAVNAQRRLGDGLHQIDQPAHGLILERRRGGRRTVEEVRTCLGLGDGAFLDQRFVVVRDRLLDGRDRAVDFFTNDDHCVKTPLCSRLPEGQQVYGLPVYTSIAPMREFCNPSEVTKINRKIC